MIKKIYILLVIFMSLSFFCALAQADQKQPEQPQTTTPEQPATPEPPSVKEQPAPQTQPTTKEKKAVKEQPAPLAKPALEKKPEAKPAKKAKPKEKKMKVAIPDLKNRGVKPELAATVTGIIVNQINKLKQFEVISSDDIKSMLEHEQQKQMLGCQDDSCLADLGGALGADRIIAGSLGKMGVEYVLQLKLINIKRASVERRESKNVRGGEEVLIEMARDLAYMIITGKTRATTGALILKVNQAGAEVLVDGNLKGKSPFDKAMIIKAGKHDLLVRKDGYITWKGGVNLRVSEELLVDVKLIPLKALKISGVSKYSLDTWGWVALGIGVAAGAGSGAFGYLAKESHDKYDAATTKLDAKNFRQETETRVLTTNALMVGAAGSAIISVLFFTFDAILEKSEPTAESSNSSLTPYLAHNGSGIGIAYRY